MNDLWIILLIPIIWYFIAIGYQLTRLIKLWITFKLQNIKETQLWD